MSHLLHIVSLIIFFQINWQSYHFGPKVMFSCFRFGTEKKNACQINVSKQKLILKKQTIRESVSYFFLLCPVHLTLHSSKTLIRQDNEGCV